MNTDTIHALSDQKPAVTVVATAVGTSALEHLGLINGVLATISLTAGIVLACILIVLRVKELRAINEVARTRRKDDK